MSKILEPHELDPALMRHACIAAVGFLMGNSILDKEGMIATLRDAVTTPGQLAVKDAELAKLREQVEGVGQRLKRVNGFSYPGARINLCPLWGGWVVLKDNGNHWGYLFQAGTRVAQVFATFEEAYQAAIAANWLKGEG